MKRPGRPDFAARAKHEREIRADLGRCSHCARGTAFGLVDVAGKALSLCAGCAGAVRRTGKLPEVARARH